MMELMSAFILSNSHFSHPCVGIFFLIPALMGPDSERRVKSALTASYTSYKECGYHSNQNCPFF